jgi:transcription elongation factor Elf1
MNWTKEPLSKECPLCGSLDVVLNVDIQQGHGDCTFFVTIKCNNCGISGGEISGGGHPTDLDRAKSWLKWEKQKWLKKR